MKPYNARSIRQEFPSLSYYKEHNFLCGYTQRNSTTAKYIQYILLIKSTNTENIIKIIDNVRRRLLNLIIYKKIMKCIRN